jgi:hypothetical protein
VCGAHLQELAAGRRSPSGTCDTWSEPEVDDWVEEALDAELRSQGLFDASQPFEPQRYVVNSR